MFTYEDVVNTANQLELFSLLEGDEEGHTPIDILFFIYIDSQYQVAPMSYPDIYIKRLINNNTILEDIIDICGNEMYELLSYMVNVMEKNNDKELYGESNEEL